MGLTNFPHGVSSFGMPVLAGSDQSATTGDVFFVDSGAGNGSDSSSAGSSPDVPFSTVDYAVSQCTADNGDQVIVMPGHTESTVTAAIGIDVAGVWVRGLGWGASRPTFTMTGTAGTFELSAASTRLSNVRLVPGIAAVVTGVAVSAADTIVEGVETLQAAVFEFVDMIDIVAAGTRAVVRSCNLRSLATIGTGSGIMLDGCDDIQIYNNVIMGHFSLAGCIDNLTGSDEVLGAYIANNHLQNTSSTGGDLVINMDAAATGLLVNNRLSGGLALHANYDFGVMRSVENYIVDAADVFALVAPETTAA